MSQWIETLAYGDSIIIDGVVLTKRQGRKIEITGDRKKVGLVRSRTIPLKSRARQARDEQFRE